MFCRIVSRLNPAWILLATLASPAVPAQGKPKVAVVMRTQVQPYQEALKGFRRGFDCDVRVYEIPGRKMKHIASEVLTYRPHLVLVIGAKGLELAKRYIKKIPVIFAMVLKPGKLPSNITGVSMTLPARVHLGALRRMAPGVKNVGIVYDPEKTGKRLEEFKAAAEALDMTIVAVAAGNKKESFGSIKLLGGRVDAFWMLLDRNTVANFGLLNSLALKEKIPLATYSHKFVADGALLALIAKYEPIGRQAARLARSLANGIRPAELGIVGAREYYYAINRDTAVKIGVRIPASVLKQEHRLYPPR